ncbi:MAG TPA: GIY-YIG nuclease family protein [Longimicrobium sp.]
MYILASARRALYVGMTNDLRRRLYEHKTGAVPGHTSRYRIDRLVYYECGPDPRAVIEREKQLKGWRRERKIALIEAGNPEWEDLADRIGLPGMVRRVT